MVKNTEAIGTVISYFGNSVAVRGADGQVFQCHLHRNQALPVVGDCVTFQWESESTGSILNIQPRRSILARGDKRGKQKPIAANIDKMVIVMSPPPVFSYYLVDRYLIAANLLAITPLLVINKIDLLNKEGQVALEEELAPYSQICTVIFSTIMQADGLDQLVQHLTGLSSVLIGPSGVGKSSIIGKLTNDEVIRIGAVSAKGAGKHTTTATKLYDLPAGGSLIDSPGVREFNLWSVSEEAILQSFKEFVPYLGKCKFRDCSHLVEPDCAVQLALKEGKISLARFESFKKLINKK